MSSVKSAFLSATAVAAAGLLASLALSAGPAPGRTRRSSARGSSAC